MAAESRYSFSLESFLVDPSLDQINKCRKCDLVQIVSHYNLDLPKQIAKKELKAQVVDHLVKLGVIRLSYSSGNVSLTGESTDKSQISILRDTGASQSVILASALPFSEQSSCGYSIALRGIEMGYIPRPMHRIYIESPLITDDTQRTQQVDVDTPHALQAEALKPPAPQPPPADGTAFPVTRDRLGAAQRTDPTLQKCFASVQIAKKELKAQVVDHLVKLGVIRLSYSSGNVSLTGESTDKSQISILRDTGASQSVILASALPFSEQSSCGYSIALRGIEMGYIPRPMHRIYIESPLITDDTQRTQQVDVDTPHALQAEALKPPAPQPPPADGTAFPVTRDRLGAAQRTDPTLQKCFASVPEGRF
ncbi:hypothetical protein JOB18_027649 [Solea senegalensis]|uniref:Peptidase A2 domain-containing protein n=1 Tax=Solea senegalensis TaxID=28829 RepID=A0AAV6PKM1_SOLSE|nr:hypothetical protein JOB18_027649 [Solea senegalensis]